MIVGTSNLALNGILGSEIAALVLVRTFLVVAVSAKLYRAQVDLARILGNHASAEIEEHTEHQAAARRVGNATAACVAYVDSL